MEHFSKFQLTVKVNNICMNYASVRIVWDILNSRVFADPAEVPGSNLGLV